MKIFFQSLLFMVFSNGLVFAQDSQNSRKNSASSPGTQSSVDNLEAEKVKVTVLPNEGSLRGVKASLLTGKISFGDFWAAITDYEHYSDFMPLIKRSKIVKSDGSTKWVDLGLKVGFTEVDYQLKMDHKIERNRAESSWFKVSGDLKAAKGSWLIETQGDLIKATYISFVDSGFLVPGWLESYLTEKSVPDLYQAILERASQLALRNKALTQQPESSKKL